MRSALDDSSTRIGGTASADVVSVMLSSSGRSVTTSVVLTTCPNLPPTTRSISTSADSPGARTPALARHDPATGFVLDHIENVDVATGTVHEMIGVGHFPPSRRDDRSEIVIAISLSDERAAALGLDTAGCPLHIRLATSRDTRQKRREKRLEIAGGGEKEPQRCLHGAASLGHALSPRYRTRLPAY